MPEDFGGIGARYARATRLGSRESGGTAEEGQAALLGAPSLHCGSRGTRASSERRKSEGGRGLGMATELTVAVAASLPLFPLLLARAFGGRG